MQDIIKHQLMQELALYTTQKKQPNLSFDSQLDLADKIHNIKMKLNGVKPTDSTIDCVGCGS
jgi:hypothetical protein|tara:strand:+ start:228 stop:413 length:186 start_codon:yes stop_codon:yes gene_type:complete